MSPSVEQKVEIGHLEDVAFSQGYVPGTKEESRLVRKMDFRILPMLWVMYIFNYIDRTNIGNAKVAGMSHDLALSATDYATALSIFFVGYLLNEVPSNMVLTRSRPSFFLPALMFTWGAMTIAVKGVNTKGGLIALRFCLGIVEAGFFPGVMFLLSCWYKPFELAKRLALFYTASLMSGAFGGLLAGAITGHLDLKGGIRGWKWLFIIEGLATCVIAIAAVFVLPDFPHSTKFLSPDERALAIMRLVTADSNAPRLTHWQAFKAAVKDYRTWTCTLAYMGITSAGTISYFFPTLMGTLGYKGVNVNYMTAPIYMACLVVCILVGFSSDKFKEKPFHILGCAVVSGISFIIVSQVRNHTIQYVFITFGGAGIWSATPLFLSYALSNFKQREQRAVSIAIINGLGNLASVYGSYIWPSKSAPRYKVGFGCTTGFILFGGCMVMVNRFLVGDLSKSSAADDEADEAARREHHEGTKGDKDRQLEDERSI